MQADIEEIGATADAIPWVEQGCERMTAKGRREDVFVGGRASQRLQQRDGSSIQRDPPRSAGLGHGHEQRASLPVHILPLGLGDLAAAGSSEQQEHDGIGSDAVFVRFDCCDKALGFFAGEKSLTMDHGGRGDPSGWVHPCAGDVPLPCEIEDVAQKRQGAIDGPGGVSPGSHVVDQPRDVPAGDHVDGERTEAGQDVDAKDRLVRMPASLAGFGMGQVAVTDKLGERGGRPQLLTTGLRISTKESLSEHRPAQASSLVKGEHISAAELELALAPIPGVGRLAIALRLPMPSFPC